MFEGLPTLFDHVSGVAARMSDRGSLQVVLHHLFGDVLNAAEYALIHYLPLTLIEPYLQNSSIGTPYQKWAKFTNEDFHRVDRCVRRLVPAAWHCYEGAEEHSASTKDAWHWHYEVLSEYSSCVVRPDGPALTLSAIHLDGWVEAVGGQFRNVVNKPSWGRTEPPPPIVTKSTCDITDRRVVKDLQRTGQIRLEEMRSVSERFAAWLRTHCTMAEITAPHRGTLSDHCLD